MNTKENSKLYISHRIEINVNLKFESWTIKLERKMWFSCCRTLTQSPDFVLSMLLCRWGIAAVPSYPQEPQDSTLNVNRDTQMLLVGREGFNSLPQFFAITKKAAVNIPFTFKLWLQFVNFPFHFYSLFLRLCFYAVPVTISSPPIFCCEFSSLSFLYSIDDLISTHESDHNLFVDDIKINLFSPHLFRASTLH